MIQFANEHTMPLVRLMWKTCFGDADDFLDILFKYKYRNENTLIYFDGDKAVASLQMLPYTMTFYGEEIPFAYLAGLCTLPEYRRRGYMDQLIHRAHYVIDPFRWTTFRSSYVFQNIDERAKEINNSRIIKLSFNYKFGSSKIKGNHSRKTGVEDIQNRTD